MRFFTVNQLDGGARPSLMLMFVLTCVGLATGAEFVDKQMAKLDELTREGASVYDDEVLVRDPENSMVPSTEQVREESALELVPPYPDFKLDEKTLPEQSYVIENKRFVEDLMVRCKENIMPKNAMDHEPTFVIANTERPDVRVNGTVPLQAILRAGFDPHKNTTIHVHGFTQSYPATPYLRRIRQMAAQNHATERENLIFIDYGKSVTSGYAKSCAASAVVSSFLALFVMKLIELGADRKSIHLAGHSLGGQVIGLAAKKINPPIGRITAIDASGPCFGRWHYNKNHSIAPGDADHVVILHFDDRLLGIPGQHGNIDVYVNGGSIQPGCGTSLENVAFQAALTVVLNLNRNYSLAHSRSAFLASSNLRSIDHCQHVAYECRDNEAFMRGECGHCDDNNSQCFFMDFLNQFRDLKELPVGPASSQRKKYYVATGDTEPFCSNHYQVLVELANQPSARVTEIQLELTDERGHATSVKLTNQMEPKVFSHLLLTESAPTGFVGARLQTLHRAENVSPFLVSSEADEHDLNIGMVVAVNFMSNIYPDKRKALSSRFCSRSLSLDGWIEFEKC